MESLSIGLDIGSSAVRAAEIEVVQGKRVLRRFAQVGLPPGAVADGEVINLPVVTEALRRLWAEGGFSSNQVVLGVSGPRVFVRQADVPALDDEDLRSSLKFDGQELVPIPMDEASFDFRVLERRTEDGGSTRILLVAAHRDALRPYLAVLKEAGLEATAMDSAALALARAVPAGTGDSPGGLEVLVSVGAELTTVAVREAGVPRFIRTLTVGGAKLTGTIANELHLETAVAERVKRSPHPDLASQLARADKALTTDIRDLAEDVRATIDFFRAQANGATIDRLLVTGGGALTGGLADAIAGPLPVEIVRITPFDNLQISEHALDRQSCEKAKATATTAVGLALWPFESPLIRLSILPEEVLQARRARRLFQGAALAVAGLIALLGVAGAAQVLRVRDAEHQTRSAEDRVTALTSQVRRLQSETAVHGQMQTRAGLDSTALKGDIDWVRLLGQLAAVLPPNLHILNFSGTRSTSSQSGASTGQAGSDGVGTVTFGLAGSGNARAAADWLDALQHDPALTGAWIGSVSVQQTGSGQSVSFSSTANLTPAADSGRAKAIHP